MANLCWQSHSIRWKKGLAFLTGLNNTRLVGCRYSVSTGYGNAHTPPFLESLDTCSASRLWRAIHSAWLTLLACITLLILLLLGTYYVEILGRAERAHTYQTHTDSSVCPEHVCCSADCPSYLSLLGIRTTARQKLVL